MKILTTILLSLILGTTGDSERIMLTAVVEEYRINGYREFTPSEKPFSMDIAKIKIIEPKSFQGKYITLTLMQKWRGKWNKPNVKFNCLISLKELTSHLDNPNNDLSNIHMEDVVFEESSEH